MVRLVFRPYTRVRRTICTSVSLLASTRVSPDFTMRQYSSPPFGSQILSSASHLDESQTGTRCTQTVLAGAMRVELHPRAHSESRLLDPCFKTGSWNPKAPAPGQASTSARKRCRQRHKCRTMARPTSRVSTTTKPHERVARAQHLSITIAGHSWSPNTFLQYGSDSCHTPSEVLFKFP